MQFHYDDDLAGEGVGWIVEEELIAIGIIDDREPMVREHILDQTYPLEFSAQRIYRAVAALGSAVNLGET